MVHVGQLHLILKQTIMLMVVAIIAISGCRWSPDGDSASIQVETVTNTTTTAPAAQSQQKAAATLTPAPTSTSEGAPLTLRFWTVEQISPLADGQTGEFVADNIQSFEQANPDVDVELLVKKTSGKGSALDFLRTAKDVAPTVLPDVVILGATDLESAFLEGLVQPLDGRLDRSIVQDLLPAARRVGTIGSALVGVPLGLEMEHTVYNTAVFTSAPVVWADVLSSNAKYVFPAKGVNGRINDVSLSQYLSSGGKIVNDQGVLAIDNTALSNMLSFYQQANDDQLLPSTLLEAATTEELWPVYVAGEADLAQISVRQYLEDRDILVNSSYSSLPVRDESSIPVSITHAWVFVLTTADVSRQDAALRLMESFLSTENNATWNQMNRSIPIRDSAYQILAQDDAYWVFLTEQLNSAVPEPRVNGYDQMGRILQQAVEQVLRGEATAEEAANTATDALSP